MQAFFVSGIGTGIGKTFVSALLAEALYADYWKPVQAGYEEGTDAETLRSLISNPHTVIHPEAYRLKMPASPHIAAREENIRIDTDLIREQFRNLNPERPLIIEGAGGLLVPLNETEMVIDLVRKLGARLILVSRNYLGSINHSLLTAEICRWRKLPVAGWVFNDRFMDYEGEIVNRTGIPSLCSVPLLPNITRKTVAVEADRVRDRVGNLLMSVQGHPGE
jgi:dethiobiotin synthetase